MKHDAIDIVDLSGIQDACHPLTQILVFLSHAGDKTKKTSFSDKLGLFCVCFFITQIRPYFSFHPS